MTRRRLKRGSKWRRAVPIEPSWILLPEGLDFYEPIVVQNRLYFNRDNLHAKATYSYRATALGIA